MINKFAAINAKIDHMYGQFLEDDDILMLARKQDLEDVFRRVNDYNFLDKFDAFENVYDAQDVLDAYKKDQVNKLAHFLTGPYKEFMQAYTRSEEMNRLKLVLRCLRFHKDVGDLTFNQLVINKQKIQIKNETIAQFIDRLKMTKYYRILKPYQNEEEDVILFYMEMNLDKLYYQDLIGATAKFSKENKDWFKKTFGRKIDLLNILWMARAKKYYQLLPEEIMNFCILGGDYYNYKRLSDLCYTKSEGEFLKKIAQTPYAFLFEGEDVYLYSHRRASRFLYYYCKSQIKFSKGNMGKLFCYLIVLESEMDDLRILFESARFHIHTEDKLKYLTRHLGHIEGSEVNGY